MKTDGSIHREINMVFIKGQLLILKRAAIGIFFIFVMSLFAEFLFIILMRLFGHKAFFTSFYTTGLFSVMSGFIPFYSTSSALGTGFFKGGRQVSRISPVTRVIIFLVNLGLVVVLSRLCRWYLQRIHFHTDVSTWVFVAWYLVIAVVMLLASYKSFRRPKSDDD